MNHIDCRNSKLHVFDQDTGLTHPLICATVSNTGVVMATYENAQGHLEHKHDGKAVQILYA